MVNIRIKMTGSAAPIIFVPDTTTFPLRKDLPLIPGPPEGVAWLWGKDDKIGQLNFLTPTTVGSKQRQQRLKQALWCC